MSQHAQNPSKALPAALSFEGAELKIVDRAGRPWLAGADLARALGYSDDRSVSRIFKQHAHEFSEAMSTVVDLTTVKGMPYKCRIFSPRGCHLVAMFSRTARAAAFRRWVLDVLEQYDAPAPSAPKTQLEIDAEQVPLALLRCVRVLFMLDGYGRPQAQAVPDDAMLVSADALPGLVTDPGALDDETLRRVLVAGLERLQAATGNNGVQGVLREVDPDYLLVLQSELYSCLYRAARPEAGDE